MRLASNPERKSDLLNARRNIDWDSQPLGLLTDAAIARQLGCGISVVRTARTSRAVAPPRGWNHGKPALTNKERYQRNRTHIRARQKAAYNALPPEKKEARFAQSKAWYKAHPGAKRAQLRKRKYGLDENAFNALLKTQGDVCALCKQPGNIDDKKGDPEGFVVDHDHSTQAVRGILHRRCNLAIGLFDDDTNRLLMAVKYLTQGVR